MNSLFAAAQACIVTAQLDEKVTATHSAAAAWRDRALTLVDEQAPQSFAAAGRPEQINVVRAAQVAKRGVASPEAKAALLHAIAHIEFSAVNLAWDAVYRFRGMPEAYYDDWVRVADEEATHFGLLRERLRAHGFDYGDFPVHDGLWNMAGKTAHDVLERMALVPRVFEARGLDATPAIIARLRQAGDEQTVAVLEIIQRDEVGHVAIGTRWFQYCCAQRGVESLSTFRDLIRKHFGGKLRGPFAYEARRSAGFSEEELAMLDALAAET